MMKRHFALLPLLAVLLAACAPGTVDHEQISAAQRTVARFNHVTAENSPKHLAAVRFADAAAKRLGERVEIQVYANSQLYKDGEDMIALQKGAIQFIAVAPSKLTEFDSEWQVFDLPYLFSSFADVERLYNSPIGLRMRENLEAKGLVALAIWPNGFMQFTNNRHPLVAPGDFSGLAFRIQAEQVLQDQYRALGARAVVNSFHTVYADIEKGQLDGQENTFNNIYTRNLQRLQPFLTISNHGYLAYVVLTQARWWQSQNPEVRQALLESIQEATLWIRENADAINQAALAKIIASGVQVRTLSSDERKVLQTAFVPVYRNVEKRLGPDFLAQVLSTVRPGP
ncbi:MAG TPA: DctP family TRAP transporter solute-binding subunit [Symbiobacteriaceae bacterium]|jgi:C4-dicarboxylate-binding protein DctP